MGESEAEKVRGWREQRERKGQRTREWGAPLGPVSSRRHEPGAPPQQVSYPVFVEGSEHALYILGGFPVACDLEEALKLVHEECAAGALHHELLVPLLQLCHVHLTSCLGLLPAELLPHPGPQNVTEQGSVSPPRRLWTDSLG